VSIDDLAARIDAALVEIDTARALLVDAARSLADAGTGYATLGQTSNTGVVDAAAALLREAYTARGRALQAADGAVTALHAYLAAIGASRSTGTPPARIGPAPPAEPWRLPPARVDELRGELPPEITPAERGTGRKTHGRWVGADGRARPVTSGVDAASRRAEHWFRAHGLRPASVTHAEMKIAYVLRRAAERTGQTQHASVVINNAVCSGDLSCARLLPAMLPEGSTLTVHAPRYRRTFTGGQRL
jgi:nucleic acid/nucleotide deaminase of polymorphic system toxin